MVRNLKKLGLSRQPYLVAVTAGLLLLLEVCPFTNAQMMRQKQNVTCISHDTKFSCDCHNSNQPMQLPHLIGNVFQVEITNCPALEIEANALTDTQSLRKITFRNVQNLVLHKYALAFPRYASNTPLIIDFQQVSIKLIDSHAIDGNIEELSFIGGQIETIRPFGFTTIKEHAVILKMHDVWIRSIEPQAFKKFTVLDMEIVNCVFEENLPSKAFYDIEVTNLLRLHNNKFKEVHTHALTVTLTHKISITSNNFVATDAEWLEAYVNGGVSIIENTFGNTSAIAFKGMRVHRSYLRSEPLELKFYNNTITSPYTINALEFNERLSLSLKWLYYENIYDCSNLDRTQKPPMPTAQFFQRNVENIYFLNAATNAPDGAKDQRFLVLSKIISTDCAQSTYLWYIVGGVVLFVIILIAIIVAICVVRAKRKRKRRKLDIVRPEPRTYTETQIIYQIENAGLLKTDL